MSTLAQAARLALDNKETGTKNVWQSSARKLISAAESGRSVAIGLMLKQNQRPPSLRPLTNA